MHTLALAWRKPAHPLSSLLSFLAKHERVAHAPVCISATRKRTSNDEALYTHQDISFPREEIFLFGTFSQTPLRRANFIRTHFEIVSRNPVLLSPPLLYIVSIVVAVSLALGIISLLYSLFLCHYSLRPPVRPSEIFRCEKKFLTKIGKIVPPLSFALIIGLLLSDEHECAFLAIRFTAVAAPTKRGAARYRRNEEHSAKRELVAIILAIRTRITFHFELLFWALICTVCRHRQDAREGERKSSTGAREAFFIKFLLFLFSRRAMLSRRAGG